MSEKTYYIIISIWIIIAAIAVACMVVGTFSNNTDLVFGGAITLFADALFAWTFPLISPWGI